MGAKQSTNTRMRTYSNAGDAGPAVTSNGTGGLHTPSTSGVSARARARSLGSVHNSGSHSGHPLSIPTSNGGAHGAGSPDSDTSTPEEGPSLSQRFLQASSLPVHLLSFHGECLSPVNKHAVPCGITVCRLVDWWILGFSYWFGTGEFVRVSF